MVENYKIITQSFNKKVGGQGDLALLPIHQSLMLKYYKFLPGMNVTSTEA